MMKLKVLVACEFSGIVRDAFIAAGHNAISCDLLPTERPGPHIEGSALDHIHKGYDLMIAHPPCQYLCNSGVRWLYRKDGMRDDVRWQKMKDGALFFRKLMTAPIPFIAIENSIMHRHAREIIGRKADQVIQPWQHGHGEVKATCFWLKNLPRLQPTDIVSGRAPRVHHASPSKDRWKERSRTLPGVAKAIAEQWGAHVASAIADHDRKIQ